MDTQAGSERASKVKLLIFKMFLYAAGMWLHLTAKIRMDRGSASEIKNLSHNNTLCTLQFQEGGLGVLV